MSAARKDFSARFFKRAEGLALMAADVSSMVPT